MLTITKWKLYLARCCLWFGLLIMIGSIPAVYLGAPGAALAIIAFGGAALFFIGAFRIDSLYRCPRCGHKLLVGRAAIPVLPEECASHCPGCGYQITVEITNTKES